MYKHTGAYTYDKVNYRNQHYFEGPDPLKLTNVVFFYLEL